MKNSDPSEGYTSSGVLPPPLRLRPKTVATPMRAVLKVFATGLTGGMISVFSLTMLASTQQTMGATRGLQIDRQRQQRCLDLGITPEALEAVESREASAVGSTELDG